MIHDFNSGTVGWTDWNILLDERGRPSHVQVHLFAIHGDTDRRAHFDPDVLLRRTLLQIHAIEPGARRVSTSASRSTIEHDV